MYKKPLFTLTVFCLLSPLFTGCSLAPRYATPDMPVSQTWPAGESYGQNAEFEARELDLDVFVQNERLRSVINLALEANRDLRSQIADMEAARAAYRIQRAELFPSVSADASGTRAQGETGSPTTTYSADIGLSSFEIDLFGKNRSLTAAALESYLSSEKTVEAARVSLVAETVGAWITLAADMELLRVAQDTVASAKRSLQIAESRHRNGVTSKLDVYQAESVLRQSEADAAKYTAAVAQDINALELLAGGSVARSLLPDGFNGSESWLGLPSAGMASNVLLRRPDVAAAEHTLKSANANIGAARAAFFPSITLFSSAGRASSELSDLFSGGSTRIWSFVGGVNLPIFSGGARVADLEYAEAKYASQLAQYDKSVQTAFREVADALARRGTINAQIEAQNALVDVSQRSYSLSEKRYSSGVETYLNVLQAQRDHYTSKQGLIDVLLLELDNRITLYRVLGGGKDVQPDK